MAKIKNIESLLRGISYFTCLFFNMIVASIEIILRPFYTKIFKYQISKMKFPPHYYVIKFLGKSFTSIMGLRVITTYEVKFLFIKFIKLKNT